MEFLEICYLKPETKIVIDCCYFMGHDHSKRLNEIFKNPELRQMSTLFNITNFLEKVSYIFPHKEYQRPKAPNISLIESWLLCQYWSDNCIHWLWWNFHKTENTFVKGFIGHSVDIANTALWYKPLHYHIHTAFPVGAPHTATERQELGLVSKLRVHTWIILIQHL